MTVISSTTTTGTPRLPPPASPGGFGPWLNRVDRNGRRLLLLHIAPGFKALADIIRESSSNFPSTWQATSSFLYTANILLIPSMTDSLTRYIAHLRTKRQWTTLKSHHLTNLFHSSLTLLISTFYAATGLKRISQLSGYTVEPLERGLNTIFPWLRLASSMTAIGQVHDLVMGSRFRAKINDILKNSTDYKDSSLVLCDKALKTIDEYRRYIRNCKGYQSSVSAYTKVIRNRLKNHPDDGPKEESISLFRDTITLATYLTQVSSNQTRYQTLGLLIHCVRWTTLAMTNTIGISVLSLAISVSCSLRDIFWNNDSNSR